MTITIYDKDANGSYFSDRQLYNTVLHEIGHALGIMGHSYSTDDLMYMAEGGMSVADVAYRCGFSDPKYFSRCFKKIMGCSPTEYIRKANPDV